MARCAYCECELPDLERVCRSCFDEHYFSPNHPKGTTSQYIARLLRLAPLTCCLIGINVLIFLMMLPQWRTIFGPSEETLIRWGADYGPLTMDGQYWRLITATFIHWDVGHVIFNMLGLLTLGLLTERAFGKLAFLLGYFGSGLCGSLASQFFHPNDVCMGASGAIFGLAGMLLAPLAMHRLSVSPKLLARPLRKVALFATYNLVFGVMHPQTNNAAHIGGFIFGVVMGAIFAFRPHSLAADFIPSLTPEDSVKLPQSADS